MIIEHPGKVTERIVLLGQKESCVYLLDGKEEYAIVGGGMVHIVPDVIEQLGASGIDEEKIKRIIILHSHFDHCFQRIILHPPVGKRRSFLRLAASRSNHPFYRQ